MTRTRNAALFCCLAAAWGAAFMAIKAGLGGPDAPGPFYETPVLFAAVRYDVAGVLMLGYAAVVLDDPLPRTRAQLAEVTVGAVFLIAAYHAFLFVGELNTTSAAAATIVSLSPVLTTAIARGLLPSDRLDAAGLVGLLLGLVGAVIIADPFGQAELLTANVLGKLLVFAATLSFAFGSVLARRIDSGLDVEAMEAWSMLGGALLMHVVSLGLGEPAGSVGLTMEALLALGYLSVVASALGFLVYFDLLERLGPVEINLVSYVAPVFAAVTGYLFLREAIDATTVVGFLVIVVGFVLLKRDAIRAEVRSVRGGPVQGDD
ncbi:DMT family transporter [Halomarina salina]|uniref:DMT family transporter n=1 Tax=Halomarina salina TaxID=1872699 RepID=A0ABD5RQ88_9EURY